MTEILISDPPLNRNDRSARYSTDQRTLRLFSKRLHDREITPDSYPIAIDIFSGDGSMAFLLHREGWDPGNITCIDQAKSLTPLVNGVKWLYWDLDALENALTNKYRLPPEIEIYRGRFDLAMSVQSLRFDSGVTVCQFLVRPGGAVITD